MTQSNQRTDTKGIDGEAAEWAVRLQLRKLTDEEQAELDLWLEADTRHRGALLRARAAWVDLDRLAALAGGPRAAPAAASETQSPAETTQVAPSLPPQHDRWRINTRRRFVAGGLSALTLGAVGAWWVHRRGKVYVSAVGEVRSVTLSDGSAMVLNTATEATVRFDPSRREVELDAGEGLFQVAKDPKRPFIVRAGSVSVRAVGTIFAVRTVDRHVDVTVTEGVVELRDGSGSAIRVAANEHAVVNHRGQVDVQHMPPEEADRRLAWREGMLDFAGESLAAAVEEVNRHNNRHIVLDDPTLNTRPVVGLFRANDPIGFAATVATALGLESVDEDDAIHLRTRLAR